MISTFLSFNYLQTIFNFQFLLFILLLPAYQLHALQQFNHQPTTISQRKLIISNTSKLHFDINLYVFPNTKIISPITNIKPEQSATIFLQNALDPFANATVWFKLNTHTVFSVVMVNELVSIQGCKSQYTLFHRSNYICKLEKTPSGLHLKISSSL